MIEEITESAMMDEQNRAVEQLSAIRALGVRLLVDDFGTGYSSLSQLQKFAMDGLKIDRAFTMELGRSEQGEVFVRAILSMAHALGMSVVAEGWKRASSSTSCAPCSAMKCRAISSRVPCRRSTCWR
jgi:EAL domain-containing protein (putative c-di-GMP-specific phosphodiesterase class I)